MCKEKPSFSSELMKCIESVNTTMIEADKSILAIIKYQKKEIDSLYVANVILFIMVIISYVALFKYCF